MSSAVLWTGGKDCCLALYRALENNHHISTLVTFIPKDKEFKAHPLELIKKQASDLGLPLLLLEIVEPFKESYVQRLKELKDSHGVSTVITGDIDYVSGCSNWIKDCCEMAGLESYFPLWQEPRLSLLQDLLKRKMEVQISWINHPSLPWEWIGRHIDEEFIRDIEMINRTIPVDLCGENGEYHTMVLNLKSVVKST